MNEGVGCELKQPLSVESERCYFTGLQKDTFSKTTNITQNSLFFTGFYCCNEKTECYCQNMAVF